MFAILLDRSTELLLQFLMFTKKVYVHGDVKINFGVRSRFPNAFFTCCLYDGPRHCLRVSRLKIARLALVSEVGDYECSESKFFPDSSD